jgi:hypothetical protein
MTLSNRERRVSDTASTRRLVVSAPDLLPEVITALSL